MKNATHFFCTSVGAYLAYREDGIDGADLLFGWDAVLAAIGEVRPGSEEALPAFEESVSVAQGLGLPSQGERRPVPSIYVRHLSQLLRVAEGGLDLVRKGEPPSAAYKPKTCAVFVPARVLPPAAPHTCGFLVGIEADRTPTVVGFVNKEHAGLEMRKRRWDRYRTTEMVMAKIRACPLPDRGPIDLFELSGPFGRVVADRLHASARAFFAWKQRS